MQESTESDERRKESPDTVEQLQNEKPNRDLIAERLAAEAAIDAGGVAGLHLCASCGVELDGDDARELCELCERAAGTDRLGSRQLLAEQDAAAAAADLGTYSAMLTEYLREQRHWIGPAQTPLVFHLRKIGAQLDERPDAPASLSSAYLQAFHRLDRQRPGAKESAGAGGDLPGQGSIFDELD